MTITRFSSRTHKLDKSFLLEKLQGATSYKRIAGYFTSSLFEVAGEVIAAIPEVKIVCNSDIHPRDFQVAQLRNTKMLSHWHKHNTVTEALLQRDRYQQLDAFLAKHGQVIRVAPDNICGFLHGKAGIITTADGSKIGFIGSMNETSSGWRNHYEILWQDDSAEGIAWLEAEFDYLWQASQPLPEAVIKTVSRYSGRHEVEIEDITNDGDLAPAALIESPLYQQGMELRPWQQGFVTECLRHYNNYSKVRLLLADEVGLGKTLSLGTAALILCLLADKNTSSKCKPVVIFAPATLCQQWQTEMLDKLGIPCARWHTNKKVWLDTDEQAVSAVGKENISKCPLRIGIISTGLMQKASDEKDYLLGMKFNTVILDEAHKARSKQGFNKNAGSPNNLLAFMRDVAARSTHVLLGTATPIQTKTEDLWDLIGILHQDSNFVLGDDFAKWHKPDDVLPILTGKQQVNIELAWNLLRSPLPLVNSTNEKGAKKLLNIIRADLGLINKKNIYHTSKSLADLDPDSQECLEEELDKQINQVSFFQRENPLVRHIVLRKRQTLEDKKLLAKIAVDIHPNRDLAKKIHEFDRIFTDKAIIIDEDFRAAYKEAINYTKALKQQGKGAGFMKNLVQQRICSSIAAGISTAKKLLAKKTITEETDDEDFVLVLDNPEEISVIERMLQRLEKIKHKDPKLTAVLHYLEQENWLEHGVIIFSGYYDTALWLAEELAARYATKAIGLYAGANRSKLFDNGEAVSIAREQLKQMVSEHKLEIMVATDAACEGLNLQTLGTLINIDLPWNPTKLEQRIGRIKRIGQSRSKVDMLNLVNAETVDEKVYEVISQRMQDRFDLFGGLPDTIEADWIENIEELDEKMDEYINKQKQANAFELRYNNTITPTDMDWRDCCNVLSRQDFNQLMRKAWDSKNS